MRLVTFQTEGLTRLGAEWNDRILDLQNLYLTRLLWNGDSEAKGRSGDLEEAGRGQPRGPATPMDLFARVQAQLPMGMLGFVSRGEVALTAAREAITFAEELATRAGGIPERSGLAYRRDAVKLKAPIARPPKVICLGLNYRDHAAESGAAVPTEPIVFTKYSSAIIGPEEPILLPPTSKEVDYEAELVFVMGRGGKNIPEREAASYVAGYTCGNDVSARDYQIRRGGGQWTVGKTFDTFGPIGPALVTADEVGDPHALGIRCVLNGETLQNSNTSQMVFNVPQIVAYLSHVMTLEPGDVVFTGTPPGVGFARKPPIFLKAGDVVEIQIDGLGVLRNPVRAG